MGGWTRIWLTLSVVFLLVGVFQAWSVYAGDSGWFETCQLEINAGTLAGDTGWQGVCAPDVIHAKSPALALREDERALELAAGEGLLFVWLVPSALVGMLFVAVGWIRRGFRRAAR